MDEAKNKILEELGGIPEQMYDELVNDFMNQLEGQLGEIESAFLVPDIERVGRLAHSIRGVAANLRMASIEAPARLLEAMASSSATVEQMQSQINALKAVFIEIKRSSSNA